MIIIKRDGREVAFDKEKIRIAVKKAYNEVEQRNKIAIPNVDRTIGKIVNEVCDCLYMSYGKVIRIETIQDTVEDVLMEYNHDHRLLNLSMQQKFVLFVLFLNHFRILT